MNDTSKLVEAFGQVAIASIADAVDKVCEIGRAHV
mgnify:CR=1 FL=1